MIWTVALLEKDGVISALSYLGMDKVYLVSNYCGRTNSVFTGQATDNPFAAKKQFDAALAETVTDNGWKLVYYGPPRWG